MIQMPRSFVAIALILAASGYHAFSEDAASEVSTDTVTADFSDDMDIADDESENVDESIFEDPFTISTSDSTDTAEDIFADPFGSGNDDDANNESLLSESDAPSSIDDFFGDIDSLFQGEIVAEVENPQGFQNPEQDLLSSEQVTWGGKIRAKVSSDWNWNSTNKSNFDFLDPTVESLSPSVSADLYIDARPNAQFRAFSKLKLVSTGSNTGADLAGIINNVALVGDLPDGWTREVAENGDTVIKDETGDVVFTVAAENESEEDEPSTGSAPAIDISVYELFADFNYKERIFFRFGKHTIQWGVGYFFSPADVLNLTAIDPEDAAADREGPISLKVQFPVGQNNWYLYIVTNVDAKPEEVAIAPKFEFVTGSTEIGVGAYYQKALSPRLIAMASSSIGDVDLFGEAIVSIGSDRVFVRPSLKTVDDFADPPEGLDTVLDTVTVDSAPFVSVTIGGRYLKDLENNLGSLSFFGQYFYNGEGYAHSDMLKPAVFLLQNADTNGLTIADAAEQPESYEAPPELRTTDLSNWGRHYIAANAGWSNIGDSDFSVSVLFLANLSDLSGIISPAIQFPFLDTMNISVAGRLTFGNFGDEYTNPAALINAESENHGGTFSISVSASLSGGGF